MIISTWSKTSVHGDGELWAYPSMDETGAYVTLRVVAGGKVIDWMLAPDEAELLMAMLKKVADKAAPMEPVPEPVAAPVVEEAPEPIGEVFVRQEPQQARPATSLGERLEGVLDKFRA